MSVGNQRVGMVVVGDKVAQARINLAVCNSGSKIVEVLPRGTLTDLGIHAQAQFGKDIFRPDGLVARRNTGCDICIESTVRLANAVVTGSGTSGFQRCIYLLNGVVLTRKDARIVHHLSESDHTVPAHGFLNTRSINACTGILKARNGWNTRRRGNHCFQRNLCGNFGNFGDTFKTGHVAKLVGIPIDARGAMRHDGARILVHSNHGTLNMDVSVHKARCYKRTLSVNNTGLLANAMRGRIGGNAHIRHAPAGNSDIGILKNLVRSNANQASMTDNQLSGLLSLCNPNKGPVALPQRHLTKLVKHIGLPSVRP